MNKPETGKQVLELHTKYIINGEKPEASFPLTGSRYLNRDEMYEIARAFREAIISFRPRLVVIDPIQAYVENDSDLMSASKARRLMKRTGIWASMYDCAM